MGRWDSWHRIEYYRIEGRDRVLAEVVNDHGPYVGRRPVEYARLVLEDFLRKWEKPEG
ncbi:hypothetical protein GCM10012275_52190 [Longimycelium tulufanense]|uniref:Uncharacterized protein n=1 Tax=Longimycelium tulufanense TaxID=907463 RepID=A0A8J3FW91_9PSEU|nr:hypothetical protein [Longimycelium tulufanense]GGM75007.1 hypothetical protein GCM10012275_52190 [Longimycelium tulufanense]